MDTTFLASQENSEVIAQSWQNARYVPYISEEITWTYKQALSSGRLQECFAPKAVTAENKATGICKAT